MVGKADNVMQKTGHLTAVKIFHLIDTNNIVILGTRKVSVD
jgi:hypothetical protein